MPTRKLSQRQARHALRLAPAAGVALIGLLLATIPPGCGGKKGGIQAALSGEAATSGTILSALRGAEIEGGITGTVTNGDAPTGSAAQFTLTLVPGSAAITNGGTATITATSATAFSELYVAVQGLDAYYLFVLPAPTTSSNLLLTVDQDYRDPEIVFEVSAGDGVDVGPVATQSFTVVQVGSGDVQINLNFDQQDDVDLHVIDPNGEEVYWGNRTAASGGTLDLDANPACGSPFGNSENITWPEGTAPAGDYEIYVNLYADCIPGSVNWTLTVTVVGNAPQIFTGTLSVVGSPVLVTTVTVSS